MPRVLVDLLSYTGKKGGMETYARELYRAFGRMDTEFEFVGLISKEGAQRDTSWFPGRVVDSGISGENRFEWAYGELFKVSPWADRLGADLIHCPALLGPIRSTVPTVLTLHDLLYWSHPELMAVSFYTKPVKWMEKKAAANASRVLTISEASRGEIVKHLGFDEDRLDVVPLAGTTSGHTGTFVRRPDPSGLILATGNRLPHKNWASLIRALPLIPVEKRPTLVITGSHGDDPLRPIVDELKLEPWVKLLGWISQEELQDLYERATIMAMPSYWDGFCLPALESMMVGLPVMLSDISVYREVGGDAALYFDPRSLQDIADTMVKATSDPGLMASLSAKGYEQAAKFSWDATAEGTLDSFRKALDAVPVA